MKKYYIFFIVLFLLSCDPERIIPKMNTEINIYLSDTSGIIKLGDTISLYVEIPEEIKDSKGNLYTYNSVKFWEPTVSSKIFLIDSTRCYNFYFGFISNKSGISKSGFEDNYNNYTTKKATSYFIAKDTGYFIFDCSQLGLLSVIKNGKKKKDNEQYDFSISYNFKAKNFVDEISSKFPCIKPEADFRKTIGVGYYAFKVVK